MGGREDDVRLKDKVAVITGAAGNIGAATARLFHAQGARVALVDFDAPRLKEIAAKLGGDRVAAIVADVTKASDVRRYAEEAAERFGPIDVFFNNAGIEGPLAPITEFPEDGFAKVMAVNVTGVFLGTKYVAPKMREGGSIIITSSVAGLKGSPNFVGYTTSKHAVIGIMRSAAIDLAPRRIRVNTLHPGMVESEMMRRIEGHVSEDTKSDARPQFMSRILLGRYVLLDEVADVVLFLASDESRMTTGNQFVIDGGFMAS
jgi:NAD(P)-dependent dehydrogenase (short-subunit alcohol dehydrogenase family)